MAERRRLIARLRSLQAPTAEWASLTAGYADAYEAWFAAMADGAAAEAFDGPTDRLRDLHRERARLRAAGRANAAAMLAASPAARRVRKKPGP